MLCATVDEFELQERKLRRERGRELARKGLTPQQIAERLGVSERTALRWKREAARCR